jgi:2-alkyl-3-oxoalkanoate reductase
MKQRVLVLGASGFIGSRIVKALAASDWATPISASRRTLGTGVSAGESAGVQLDATDPQRLQSAMDGVTGVVNCVSGSNDTIVNGARALFSVAANMKPPPRIVHLSSMAVYGAAVGEVDESTLPVAGLSPYGAAKLEAEKLINPDSSVVVFRPGIVYGPQSVQWSGRMAQLLRMHRLGDLGSSGDGYCNLVYIDDVVQAILIALRLPNIEGKVFNLSLPDPPTWNEYFGRFAEALGAVPLARITKRRLQIESKLLAPLQKIAELVLRRLAPRLTAALPQAIPPSLIRLFEQEIKMKVDRVERALGLRWTPLDQGLRLTANWYRAP